VSGLITLLTDFGLQDSYVGVMKGVIFKINPRVEIIDITHFITPHSIEEAAFVLFTAYKYFPQNAVHVAVVDPGVGSERKIVLAKTGGYFFLAPDNGLLTYVLEHEKEKLLINVTNCDYFLSLISSTFHARDIFAPVAAYLSKGVYPEQFGSKLEQIVTLPPLKPKQTLAGWEGRIIHQDRFGNLTTNFKKDLLTEKDFSLLVKGREIRHLSRNYVDSLEKELIMLWGSSGYLEIALKNSSAADFLQVGLGELVEIRE
jgi:S-adenosyl-L-methionine hydrolase (adenosine-forming)